VASSPSTRLVDSISRDVSGSAVTVSSRLSATPSGSSAGSSSGSGSGAGLGGGGRERGGRALPGALPIGGASTSRTPGSKASACLTSTGRRPASLRRRRRPAPGAAPHRRTSAVLFQRLAQCAPSAEMSANSFSAAKHAGSARPCASGRRTPRSSAWPRHEALQAYSLASLR